MIKGGSNAYRGSIYEYFRNARLDANYFQNNIGGLARGNHQQLLDSITQRLWPMGGDTHFVPGHGPMSTFAHERSTNPFVADRVLQRA